MSHFGVLFLDELLEFNKNTIEVLRGPLEDKEVNITRAGVSLKYPCNFMLVASMNPCPCGYFGSVDRECTCSERQRMLYRAKLSGPMLDRFDIQVHVPSVDYKKFQEQKGETSQIIKERVNKARKIQIERYGENGIIFNAELTPQLIEKYCKLDKDSSDVLKNAFEKLKLSARAYTKILKVARTIADLEGKNNINKTHILEAIGYRALDRL